MARQWKIGQIDQRISLQRSSDVDDGAGGSVATWTEYAEVWAHVVPLSGREREQQQRAEATSNYLVVIRYRSDVVEGHKIRWRGRELNVRFVRSEGPRTSWLEIEAEMGAAA